MSRSTLVLFVAAMVMSPMMMMINGQDLGTPDSGENKCGGCPCNSPCTYASPPPPPPPSSPPPPKKPPTPACPPPPGGSIVPTPPGGSIEPTPPSYIYITGPPGDVYPVDHNFSGVAGGRNPGTVGLITVLFLIAFSILDQLAL